MAGKKYVFIVAVSALVAGCALDDIAEKPTCTTGHDFSQQEEDAPYATEAVEDLRKVCPDVIESVQFCYQNLQSPNNYLCTICPRDQFFCNNECIDTPCTTAQCHYTDDFIVQDTPEYAGLPVENISCLKEKPEYPYCYSHDSRKSDFLCSRCAQASDTPRYCAKTGECVDTYCEDCGKVHLTLEINGEKTDLCAIPIASAEDFVNASKESKSTEIYALTKDIDLSDFDAYSSGNIEDWKGFYQFGGKFVASEPRTISIKGGSGTLSCGTSPACGLFPILEGATIHNISLNFNLKHTGYAGLLAGAISQSTIEHVKAKGNVSASPEWIGGIAGTILENATLTDISFSGKVDAPEASYVGGIAGGISKQTTANDLKIEEASTISGKSYVGGIAGFVSEDAQISNVKLTIDTAISGENIVGGIIGAATVPLSDLTSNGTVTMTTQGSSNDPHFAGGIVGLFEGASLSDLANKATLNITNLTNPALVSTSVGGITGAIIENATLTNLQNKGKINYNGTAANDIYSPINCTVHIGGVVGTLGTSGVITHLDGASNLGEIKTDNAQCVGGIVGKGTNVTIKNAQNDAAISSTGNDAVGGIAGTFVFEDTPLNDTPLAYSNLKNTAEIIGNVHVGGIVGSACAGFYQAIDLVFSNLSNSGTIKDTDVTGNILTPHGGIIGMLAAKTKSVVLTDLQNTGEIASKASTPTGGLIGHWKNFETASTIIPDPMQYILRRAYSRAPIQAESRIGGLIGQLSLSMNDKQIKFTNTNHCIQTCYNSQIDMTIEDVFAEGALTGTSYIGGLIGYLDSTPGTQACEPDPDASDCAQYTIETPNYTNASTLNIQNAYTFVDISGTKKMTGLIGQLNTYKNPSDTNKIIIDNFYFKTKKSTLSGIFCSTATSDLAIPEVTHLYTANDLYERLKDNDYIAPKVNTITTFQNKYISNAVQLYIDSKPLVDVLNENRGDHAEWKDVLLSGTNNYYPTLLIPQADTP